MNNTLRTIIFILVSLAVLGGSYLLGAPVASAAGCDSSRQAIFSLFNPLTEAVNKLAGKFGVAPTFAQESCGNASYACTAGGNFEVNVNWPSAPNKISRPDCSIACQFGGGCNIDDYRVIVRRVGVGPVWNTTVGKNKTSYTIPDSAGLQNGVEYKVVVKARYKISGERACTSGDLIDWVQPVQPDGKFTADCGSVEVPPPPVIPPIIPPPPVVPNQSPVAVATISRDGVTYADLLPVTQGIPATIHLSAVGSDDPDGWTELTNGVSNGGQCKWLLSSWGMTDKIKSDPVSAVDCNDIPYSIPFSDPLGTYTYDILQITDNQGATSSADTVSINVLAKPAVNVTADGSDGPITVDDGTNVTLDWSDSSSEADFCTASGDWSGGKTTSGSEKTGTLSGPATKTYTITCTDDATGVTSDPDTVVVNVLPPTPKVDLKVEFPTGTVGDGPVKVPYGKDFMLKWMTENCDGVSGCACTASSSPDASVWNGSKATAGGSDNITNLQTSGSFTIECRNGILFGSDTVSILLIKATDWLEGN